MTCVHFKFSSALTYEMITFEGRYITLGELKRRVKTRKKLRVSDLLVFNAQTNEEYTDDGAIIPNNTAVILKQVPIAGGKLKIKRSFNSRPKPSNGSSKAMGDSSVSLEQLLVSDNLIEANASEDDKIKAVMFQTSRCFYPVDYARQLIGLLPLNYVCFRCGIPGHLIKYCPNIGAPKFDGSKQPKKCSGIPRSFMVKVDDPNRKGVMRTNDGQFVIPIINVEAYANGKKERPPFLTQDEPSSPNQEDPVPDELLCLICQELMTDAVVIPCCRNSYCDECIRTCLLESDEHVCPTCKQSDVSPDSLNANMLLRQKVNHFTNGAGGTDGIYRTAVAAEVQVQVPQPPSVAHQQYPVQCSPHSYNILSPVLASVSPNLQAPWMAPVPQPPKASLSSTVPFQSKEKMYRQQRRLKEDDFSNGGSSYPSKPRSRSRSPHSSYSNRGCIDRSMSRSTDYRCSDTRSPPKRGRDVSVMGGGVCRSLSGSPPKRKRSSCNKDREASHTRSDCKYTSWCSRLPPCDDEGFYGWKKDQIGGLYE